MCPDLVNYHIIGNYAQPLSICSDRVAWATAQAFYSTAAVGILTPLRPECVRKGNLFSAR